MRNGLLLLSAVAVFVVSGPAHGQTFWLDTNGDGLNSMLESYAGNPMPPNGPDYLFSGPVNIDVYIDTDSNPDGSAAICDEGGTFTIWSYEVLIRYFGSGSVAYGAWTDNLSFGFGLVTCGDNTTCSAGTDIWIGRGGITPLPPGTHKIGTLAVTVTGTPGLGFATSSTLAEPAQTAFGGNCLGNQFDNTVRLGDDIPSFHAFSTEFPVDVVPTTWGKIKTAYR